VNSEGQLHIFINFPGWLAKDLSQNVRKLAISVVALFCVYPKYLTRRALNSSSIYRMHMHLFGACVSPPPPIDDGFIAWNNEHERDKKCVIVAG
jgi:hypothetical protein